MLKDTLYRIIALLYILFVFSTSLLFFIIALVLWLLTYPVDRRLRLLHRFTCFWASLYIWIFPPWDVTVQGREKIDQEGTYIIVSNHQSLVDILVAFMLFTHFKWVSKSNLFQIPLIGWNMSLNRYVKLERGNKGSIRKMYNACEKHLKEGSSVYIFPEGTRSLTGEMREFKDGAFVLAKRLNVPILPLIIHGSKDAVPKNSLNFHGSTKVVLEVLEPIPTTEFGDLTARELAQQVKSKIQKGLEDFSES